MRWAERAEVGIVPLTGMTDTSLHDGYPDQAPAWVGRARGVGIVSTAAAVVTMLSLLSGCGKPCIPESGYARDLNGNLIPRHECPPESGGGGEDKVKEEIK